MMTLLQTAMAVALGAPAALLVILAVSGWLRLKPREEFVNAATGAAFLLSTIACVAAWSAMATHGIDAINLSFGRWASIGHLHLDVELALDRLSVPFATFGAALVGLVGAFSSRYLHKESGFHRFFVLLALLGTGHQLVVLAGRMEILLFGWELVGMTSALLIAFFNERPAPVRHGLRAFVTYRVCDVALLLSIVLMHHLGSETHFIEAGGFWESPALPESTAAIALVGSLLLVASMGKSAQFPLTEWLPRAMEGPTTSSAIFYGALSIHLGPYLLLRNAPYLEASPVVRYAVLGIGTLTVLHASLVGRVQSDIKSAMAYGSATQVGLILVEISLGLHWLAIAHIMGHAALRTLQILRSPSVLADHKRLAAAATHSAGRSRRILPSGLSIWLYRYALERGFADAVAHSLSRVMARALRSMDRRPAELSSSAPRERSVPDERFSPVAAARREA